MFKDGLDKYEPTKNVFKVEKSSQKILQQWT